MLENFSFVKKSVNLGRIVQDFDPDPERKTRFGVHVVGPNQNKVNIANIISHFLNFISL